MTGRIGIDDIEPVVSYGSYPAKGVIGEFIPVSATVWREGHDAVGATLVVEGPPTTASKGNASTHRTMTPSVREDSFNSYFVPDREGFWSFRIEGWSDPYGTWRHHMVKKLEAGQSSIDLANECEIGARIFDVASTNVPSSYRLMIELCAQQLRGDGTDIHERVSTAMSDDVARILHDYPVRELVTRSRTHRVWVDRKRALFGSWYEMFPRSTGGWDADGKPVHGTFMTAAEDLPRIADMGFDVVYLPPIHPIGEVNRKGPNNSLSPGPHDVGSPWAIGSRAGGHDAIHPRLGTEDDFRFFLDRARELGLEVALDLALQCAPDHPWAREHPDWFTTLPDGTIAFAENPPKKYQDIYPINFDNDRVGIYREVLRVVMHWVSLGVKIFRVDNPHTKPPDFWEWLITAVKRNNPDVLFLSEAFTRRARLYGLARLGFTQSYTYFTWKTAKWELTEFGQEISTHADEARPNLFVNTPDILHASLQYGGPGMFAIRAALAATLSPTWGVYSGYELFEAEAVREGSEEYINSEKYELRPRDFKAAQSRGETLEPWLSKLNAIRRQHPALQQLRNLTFHSVDNDALIAYSKMDPLTGDAILVVVNINPFGTEEGTLHINMPAIGQQWWENFSVTDEVSGEQFHWKEANFIRLEPWRSVAHIVALPNVSTDKRVALALRDQ